MAETAGLFVNPATTQRNPDNGRLESVFSPLELKARIRVIRRYSSRRWRRKHPRDPHRGRYWAEYTYRWKARNLERVIRYQKRRVSRIPNHYAVQQLRQQGRPITPETIERKRAEIQAFRSRRAFRMFYATSQLASQNR